MISVRDAKMKALLGGAVVYKGELYAIREVNELKKMCVLIKLDGEHLVPDVKLSDMVAEEDYDWEENKQ